MTMFEWLQSFLSEPDGKGSSRRIIELAITWTFIFSYCKVTLETHTLPPLDLGWVAVLSGMLGFKTAEVYLKNRATNLSGPDSK